MQQKRKRTQSLFTRKYKAKHAPKSNKLAPLGNKVSSQLRYCQEVSISGGSFGNATTIVFCVNGMYDPDITGIGHQPMGFDQLTGLYNRYCVYGCRYELELANTDQTEQRDVVVGTHVNLSSSTSTDAMLYLENPDTDFRILENIKSTKSTTKFNGYIDIGKQYGRSKREITTEDDFWGETNSNPSNKVYLHIFAAGLNSTSPDTVIGVLRLTYYVWFDQYNLASKS